MSRFFIENENISADQILIKGEDVKHIKNVLRCRIGDTLFLSNGKGTDFQVRIEAFQQGQAIITQIISVIDNKTEPFLGITLFQGIPKGDKMDFIIQKSVELGVKKIIPIITERTVPRFHNEKDRENKKKRWQKVALEAAKQCDRGIIPKVDSPVYFTKILSMDLFKSLDLVFMPYEKEKDITLRAVLGKIKEQGLRTKTVGLIVGPEGGFSEQEVQKAIKCGAKSISLGPRILRTETAGIAIVTVLMYTFGEL